MARAPRVMPAKRNLELIMLLFGFGLYAFALSQVQLATILILRPDAWLFWSLPVAAALMFHFVLRFRASDADPILLPVGFLLNAIGIVMIYRLDLVKPLNAADASIGFRQVIWTVVAVLIATIVVFLVRTHLSLRRYIYTAMAVGVLLLLLPSMPIIGKTVSGATLWVSIGPLSFQPGELAKIALCIFFAGYLTQRREALSVVGRKLYGIRIPPAREVGPIVFIWLASLGVLVLQRDLGTSLLYFGLFLVLIYVATARVFYVFIGLVMFTAGALVASRLMSYVGGRLDGWLDPLSDTNYNAIGGSYQLVQSMFGLAHGGLFGTGLGGGLPNIVPLAESDFIVSALGEELGIVGLFAILILYLVLVSRAIRIANLHSDDFSKLLSIGLGFVIALQLFIVIGGVLRVVPLTGLTTPLLAAGGSSLLANWLIIGLLLRLSDTMPKAGTVN
ncbi:MAG: FtsW/RodA/SpoVE family cell cycle protein [Rhodoluna sp.]